jgi:glycosyltransferase involved in cell wall biosynthesis
LTLNEEINIAECIESVTWSDDIVVFDSLSTDKTKAIAESKGARVVEREFDNWSSHQNWAMEYVDFKNPWVFYIDADERCPKGIAEEILCLATPDSKFAAYRVRRRDYFMGQWLKRAQLYPTWLVRLFRPERMRFERLVNPIPVVDGLTGDLSNDLIHYPFSHGISHWVARHNNYSDMEAQENQNSGTHKKINIINGLTSSDPNLRRAVQKELFYKIPARPLIKFIYYYFFRRGFLDGRAGFVYSVLQAFYEYLIVLKKKELERRERGLPL